MFKLRQQTRRNALHGCRNCIGVIITERQDSCVWNEGREEVVQPECAGGAVCPAVLAVSAMAVDGYEAGVC